MILIYEIIWFALATGHNLCLLEFIVNEFLKASTLKRKSNIFLNLN
jgi:hypothetical protein